MRREDAISGGRPVPTPAVLLSVVVPTYNEEAGLEAFHRRISGVFYSMPVEAEIIYVNDGSSDGSLAMMQRLREADARVAIVDLSRNFGKEIALTAGLDHAKGAAAVIIDADLQDPPEVIPELVKRWQEGYDVVYAKRISRTGDSLMKRATAHAFYRLMQRVSRVRIPEDTGDFRLLSRRAIEALRQLREQHRFMKGLFSWIGYEQVAVQYRRDPRYAGRSKWRYWSLWNFALEGITSFTTAPLKVATYVGLAIGVGSFMYAAVVIYKTLRYGDPVAGYPSLMVVLLFLGGVQLMTLGILGEYLGRMFDESKRRPLYFVRAYDPSRSLASRCDGDVGEKSPSDLSQAK